MMLRQMSVLAAVLLLLGVADGASALGHRRATFGPATCAPKTCAPATCQPKIQYVEKTVMCPTYVTEHCTVKTIECRPEVRQRTVVEYRPVCETKMVERTYTVMVPEVRTKTVECVVNVPVWRDVTQEYTVMVPHCEKRQGTRTVCKMEPVTETRTVMEDQGHWEEQDCPTTCAPKTCRPKTCCPKTCAPKTCKVWVPDCVEKEIEVTCMKPTTVEEPYEYTVTVCKPETRTCTQRVQECKQEVRTQEVCYTVCVPQQVTKQCPVTTTRCVAEERTVQCTVMVPHEVERVVPVCRVKMVPKTIQVPVCCPAAPCGHRGCRHCRGC
ncbi:hypothetical protein ACFL5Q_03915 [Planctomycetota bacterium]